MLLAFGLLVAGLIFRQLVTLVLAVMIVVIIASGAPMPRGTP
ncbi:MAG: hypothetical protein ABSG43_02820 [Solirubrobacteraceae bacterium]